MKIYHVKTQEDYDELMVELEAKGVLWNDGKMPTYGNCWKVREERTAIRLYNDIIITYGSVTASKREFPNIPIQEYKAKQNDVVNSPNHYTQNGRETIENIRDTMSSEGYQGYCVGNVVKYLARYKFKNGLEDVKKAKKYIEFLEEELMKQED